MTILAQFKNQDVEVLNVYNSGGVKYAAVKAITLYPQPMTVAGRDLVAIRARANGSK